MEAGMALGVLIHDRKHRGTPRGARRWALVGLALASASCVPVSASDRPAIREISPPPSAAAPEAAPVPAAANPIPAPAAAAEATIGYAGRTDLDRLRSQDCLAQAIYYEAGRESEDGQRAVAQVVLNRVRHPAWPDSVCGVVYQGPMRPGGGCQFTFTCDGSLMHRPTGSAWIRARQLAAEALAGYVHARVALATHYHANYVAPSWAPRLRPAAVIGAHLFYGLPGRLGEAGAFTDAYTGVEPFPRPSFTMLRRPRTGSGLAPLVGVGRASFSHGGDARPADAPAHASDRQATDPAEAMVREEYRQSGQWREDAPSAVTGR
jgi:spore germination cell wall hydrolase CwlJ-like protein